MKIRSPRHVNANFFYRSMFVIFLCDIFIRMSCFQYNVIDQARIICRVYHVTLLVWYHKPLFVHVPNAWLECLVNWIQENTNYCTNNRAESTSLLNVVKSARYFPSLDSAIMHAQVYNYQVREEYTHLVEWKTSINNCSFIMKPFR